MKFTTYLKEQQKLIWFLLAIIAAFAGILYLYDTSLKAVIYPSLLCTCILIIYAVVDYAGKKAHILKLQDTFSGVTDSFPESRTAEEAAYQEYIANLMQQQKEQTMRQEMHYQDMVNYYTTWAHQIKTPISAMRLKLENEDSTLSRQLNSDLLRTQQYVDMVMVYLRLDAPANDYVFKSCSIDDMIKKSISTFASEFISRGLALRYQPIDGTIITDEKWFCFMLEQLLSNALKYTRKGSISIYREGSDCLCIADTGIGIAPEDMPRIFQKGYTGFNGRTNKHASGLGLYLCKRICDGLSIPISAESQPGKGTIIRLQLNQYQLKAE